MWFTKTSPLDKLIFKDRDDAAMSASAKCGSLFLFPSRVRGRNQSIPPPGFVMCGGGWMDHRLRDRTNGGRIEARNASLLMCNGDEVYKKSGISYAVEVKKDGIDRETG